VLGTFPIGSVVELASGEIGVVVGEHLMQRLKPKVLVLLARAGKPAAAPKVIDLAAGTDARIQRRLAQVMVQLAAKRRAIGARA
jgi:hypothetical protein